MSTLLDKMRARSMERLKKERPSVYDDLARVLSLPVERPLSDEELEEFSRTRAHPQAYAQGFRFREPQARGILDFERFDGVFCPIGVGYGKTLMLLMIADICFRKGLGRGIALIPARGFAQLMRRDVNLARNWVPLQVPIHGMGQMTKSRRMAIATSGQRGLYVLPYSCCSQEDSVSLIEMIDPDYIIADEAHCLRNAGAARTRRIMQVLAPRRNAQGHRRVLFVPLSGTMTKKSVMDYHHLARAALKEHSPLPNSERDAADWACVIDSGAAPGRLETETMVPLLSWAKKNFPAEEIRPGQAGFRSAFGLRLTSAPGVVSTGDSEIGTSLIMANCPAALPETADYQKLEEITRRVQEEWVSPEGDELSHAIQKHKWLVELSAGFYNSQVWPTGRRLAERRQLSATEADRILEAARDHHRLLQGYERELRDWLKRHAKDGLDTPMLVGNDMRIYGKKHVGPVLYDAWRAAKQAEFQGMPERDSVPVRVCSYKIDWAVQWAKSLDGGGILWAYNQEVVQWAYEALTLAGFTNAVHCPAGKRSDEFLNQRGIGDKIVVCSIAAHSEVKNLQYDFERQMVLQWPRSESTAEQMIGRTHRHGQEADELVVWRCDTTDTDKMVFAACLVDACYVQQSTKQMRKIMYASYEPIPELFPAEVLKERGLQPRILSREQERVLQERFGT